MRKVSFIIIQDGYMAWLSPSHKRNSHLTLMTTVEPLKIKFIIKVPIFKTLVTCKN